MTKEETRYNYEDEHRNTLFTKVRIEDDLGKTFYWEREEDGIVIKNVTGCRKILYQLPYIILGIRNGKTIYLVEGEKDAHTLLNHTLIATTAPGSLEWHDEFTPQLKDADVVILYDNDKTGLKRRDLLTQKLYGRVKSLRVVDLPGLDYREKHGLDVTDWLNMGNSIEDLKILVEQTSEYVPASLSLLQSGVLKPISLEDLLSLNIPERKMLLNPFLTEQGLVLLYAKRGVGKTHVALGIAYAVASGSSFLKWSAPEPRRVLYIDGEMPAISMQERLRKIAYNATQNPLPNYLHIITPDLQKNPIPDLATQKGRDAIEPFTQEVSLIIVDNISSLFRSGTENEAESWQPVQDWALDLRKKGKSVLFVHHAGKSGQQRGSSKKEDILDVVISLKQPADYKAEQGACFEVHFEKTRHFTGEQAMAFQVQLTNQSDGSWNWQISKVDSDPTIIEVAEMRKEGKTILEVMNKMDLTKSQVETKLRKAKEQGLLS